MTDASSDLQRPAESSRAGPVRRREEMRRRVIEEGFARIEDLARDLQVSIMTVHRDLDALERQGWLTKIRGGATANPSALVEAGVHERGVALHSYKAAIAASAAELLSPGQTVFVDDSTTAMALLPFLVERAPIRVATNFLPVVRELAEASTVQVVLLGGKYYPRQEACFGLQTVDAIHQLHADLLFMSTTAVNHGACYHRSEVTVMVKRAFMACAARTVLLVDHAKFGRPSPHLLCPVEAFDVVVTDDSVDPEDLAELDRLDVEVRVATGGSSPVRAVR